MHLKKNFQEDAIIYIDQLKECTFVMERGTWNRVSPHQNIEIGQ
jgi:hypothetical protein